MIEERGNYKTLLSLFAMWNGVSADILRSYHIGCGWDQAGSSINLTPGDSLAFIDVNGDVSSSAPLHTVAPTTSSAAVPARHSRTTDMVQWHQWRNLSRYHGFKGCRLDALLESRHAKYRVKRREWLTIPHEFGRRRPAT